MLLWPKAISLQVSLVLLVDSMAAEVVVGSMAADTAEAVEVVGNTVGWVVVDIVLRVVLVVLCMCLEVDVIFVVE